MDSIDETILDLIKGNARMSYQELGEKLGMSRVAAKKRVSCLKRAGLDTVGNLVDRISGSADLKGIRNCGAKSIREIMEHLFLFQYYSLKPEARTDYLLEVVAMNKV